MANNPIAHQCNFKTSEFGSLRSPNPQPTIAETANLSSISKNVTVFNLDLKRAEMAIDSGRLDEAFQLLQSSAEAKHANGQRLSDRLTTELLNRAQLHLDHGRLNPARRDADLAKQIGGQQIAVVQLIDLIENKQRSQAGHASDAASANLLDRLKRLVDANQHEQTIQWLATQSSSFRQSPETVSLSAKPIAQLTRQAAQDFDAGRLDRCESSVRLLQRINDDSQELGELNAQLKRCRSIDQAIRETDYLLALRTIQQAQQVSPKTSWVQPMIAAIKQIQAGLETLHAGPLGLLPSPVHQQNRMPYQVPIQIPNQVSHQVNSPPAKPQPNGPAGATCQPSLLQIDQLGGVMLLRDNSISIGTPAIASGSTIVLQTDGLTSQIQITRDGEDYFASSDSGLSVNNEFADRHLLNDGDIITVGARGRLKFLRPVAGSNSAVLIVQGAKLKRRDIRGIILVDDAIVFGDSNCHFSVPNLPRRVIVRPSGNGPEFLIHEKGSSEQHLLAYGQSKAIGGVGFTLSPVSRAIGINASTGKQLS